MDVITFLENRYKPLVVYRFYCMALFHSQTRRHMINKNIKTLSSNTGPFGSLVIESEEYINQFTKIDKLCTQIIIS